VTRPQRACSRTRPISGRVILAISNAPQRSPEYTDMASTFIAMLHYSQDLDAWLHLTGWDSPPNDRDTMAALRQIEAQPQIAPELLARAQRWRQSWRPSWPLPRPRACR
jgi:hypothetical protein